MSRKSNQQCDQDVELEELESDSEQEVDCGGQSGDTQDLSMYSEASDASVEQLASEGQAYEAGVLEGVESAGESPECPVISHQDERPLHESEIPPDPDWK